MPPKPDDSRPPIPDLLWPGVVAHISAIVANMKAVAAGEGESDGDDEGVGAMLDLVVTASETTWERLCVDLLPVMQLPLRIPAICHRVSCLNKARHQPPAATVASFKSSFREHPDWPGLYACMLVSRPLRRAVCRDPELRPLTRHGLNAVLTWLATPAGRREFDALELNHQEDILLSVSFSVFW